METEIKNKPIDINTFKVIPENLGKGFGFCVFGEVNEDVLELARKCSFRIEPAVSAKGQKYTDFFPTENTDFSKMFSEIKEYEYMDGFSPNLNKDLHIGHFSNLVLAKAFQKLEIAKQSISILGDTVCENIMQKAESLTKFSKYCLDFDYKVNKVFFASEMEYNGDLLKDGEGEYAGTKIVEVGDEKIVVIKSDGSTSYFYQDISLATTLGKDTLYLTGYEQENHFNILKNIFPHISHLGLGLVKLQTKDGVTGKMSTRLGNVIYLSELMNDLMKEFDNNQKLCYNIFAGYILKNAPKSDKVFSLDTMKNPKNSLGLYLSYTAARLKSAGVVVTKQKSFNKQSLTFNYLKSKSTLNPSNLFHALTDLCNEINNLYMTHKISDNEENKKMFGLLLSDLVFGMKKIGMFEVDKV